MILRATWLLLGVIGTCLCCEKVSADTSGNPSIHGHAMGMDYRIEFGRALNQSQIEHLTVEVRNELARIDSIFSLYRPDSELMRWNLNPSLDWGTVSEDFYLLTTRARQLWKLTEGSFDPTIRPLSKIWRLDTIEPDWKPPAQVDIEAALTSIGMSKVELHPSSNALRKLDEEIELDLNAIVEGWALTRLDSLMKTRGLADYLIGLGGEYLGRGANRKKDPWTVVIESPSFPHKACWKVEINNATLSTSGNYRSGQSFQGQWYSHVLDAKTGYPVDGGLASVAVLDQDPLTADGWATALMTQNWNRRKELASQHALSVCLQTEDAGKNQSWRSKIGMRQFRLIDRDSKLNAANWQILVGIAIAVILFWQGRQLVIRSFGGRARS